MGELSGQMIGFGGRGNLVFEFESDHFQKLRRIDRLKQQWREFARGEQVNAGLDFVDGHAGKEDHGCKPGRFFWR